MCVEKVCHPISFSIPGSRCCGLNDFSVAQHPAQNGYLPRVRGAREYPVVGFVDTGLVSLHSQKFRGNTIIPEAPACTMLSVFAIPDMSQLESSFFSTASCARRK